MTDRIHRLVFWSALATLLTGLVTFTVTTMTTQGYLVWSDGLPYFLYARSAVIDHDTDLTNEYDELDLRFPEDSVLMIPLRDWTHRDPENDRIVAPWPVGAGLVMVPFYALGYAVEKTVAGMAERPPDTYGLIPQYFFCFGSLAFGLLGFWCIFLACREVTDESAAWQAALGTVLAGPAVFYIFVNPSMAHAPSLGLVSLVTLLWLRQWNEGTRPGRLALLGLILGTAFTVRYQNALFGILPLTLMLRELHRMPALRWIATGAAGLTGLLLPLSVQLLHLYYYGVVDAPAQADGATGIQVGAYPFDLRSPYFFDVLFSSRHGAFHWAPVLLAGLAGLIVAIRRQTWAVPLLAVFLANTYLVGALGMANTGSPVSGETNWIQHWNGAPSFGMRYLTECAPLFALGLAVLIQTTRRTLGKWFWPVALALLVTWNLLLILAYGLNTISRSGPLSWSEMYLGVEGALRRVAARIL